MAVVASPKHTSLHVIWHVLYMHVLQGMQGFVQSDSCLFPGRNSSTVSRQRLRMLLERVICLQNEGEIAACNYHAGMTPKQRIQVQNQWRSGVLQVVVATIAFGMGEAIPQCTSYCVCSKSTPPHCGVSNIQVQEAPLAYPRFLLSEVHHNHTPQICLMSTPGV